MLIPAKSTVEKKLANFQKKYNQAVGKKKYPRRKIAEHIASLRVTHLAKVTSGKEAAEDIAAANWVTKSK